MTNRTTRFVLLSAVLLIVVGLPLAGKWLRRQEAPRCAMDGLPIVSLYRVRIVDGAGRSHPCCCVGCARRWLERADDPHAEVYVRDETTGAEVEARSAFFVESRVVTNAVTRNAVHTFRWRQDAEEHARRFGGQVATGLLDRPSRDR
jgi:hypothetical protein